MVWSSIKLLFALEDRTSEVATSSLPMISHFSCNIPPSSLLAVVGTRENSNVCQEQKHLQNAVVVVGLPFTFWLAATFPKRVSCRDMTAETTTYLKLALECIAPETREEGAIIP